MHRSGETLPPCLWPQTLPRHPTTQAGTHPPPTASSGRDTGPSRARAEGRSALGPPGENWGRRECVRSSCCPCSSGRFFLPAPSPTNPPQALSVPRPLPCFLAPLPFLNRLQRLLYSSSAPQVLDAASVLVERRGKRQGEGAGGIIVLWIRIRFAYAKMMGDKQDRSFSLTLIQAIRGWSLVVSRCSSVLTTWPPSRGQR